jgi:hypothetical protein
LTILPQINTRPSSVQLIIMFTHTDLAYRRKQGEDGMKARREATSTTAKFWGLVGGQCRLTLCSLGGLGRSLSFHALATLRTLAATLAALGALAATLAALGALAATLAALGALAATLAALGALAATLAAFGALAATLAALGALAAATHSHTFQVSLLSIESGVVLIGVRSQIAHLSSYSRLILNRIAIGKHQQRSCAEENQQKEGNQGSL